jgi:hypothetical protein
LCTIMYIHIFWYIFVHGQVPLQNNMQGIVKSEGWCFQYCEK